MDAVDEVLSIFAATGPEYSGGFANHGPMAAEAIITMGRADEAPAWAREYRRNLEPHPDERNRIEESAWKEALGDLKRVGDWIALFNRELSGAPFQGVLNKWVARLSPGLIASATHGVIRAGHAARSLASGATPARLAELAEGLAYWAASYETLPGVPGKAFGVLKPSSAIGQVERLSGVPRGGMITDRLTKLKEFEPFPRVIDLVDRSIPATDFLSDLTETFAGVYLANTAHDVGAVITLIHSVTGPSAVRLMLPFLDADVTALALGYAWQAAAALYTVTADRIGDEGSDPRAALNWDDLIDRSIRTRDEHAIKFTEACLREYRLNPRPIYFAAASHASDRLG